MELMEVSDTDEVDGCGRLNRLMWMVGEVVSVHKMQAENNN